MPPQKRITANPVKPARYRAGKAAATESSSESEASGSEQEGETKKAPPRRTAPPPKFASAAGAGRVISRGDGAKINLKGVGIADAEDEEARRKAAKLARLEAEKKAKEEGFVTEDEEGENLEEGSEEESPEKESSEEEEAPRRLMIRPKFIPKSQRQNNGAVPAPLTTGTGTSQPPPAPDQDDDETTTAAATEAARLKAADELVEEQIRKDVAARATGRKHWEDDASGSEGGVDDTDDIDPAAEHAA